MTRTTAPLRGTAAAVAVSALLTLWAAGPARAHGAPTDPVSRVYACSPDGGRAGTAACRAAVAANGGPFTAWDNLRVANVGGRDRQVVPDGKLCSGGLPAYKGLDLARTDWPSTRLAPSARLTMSYASTIPHEGTFRLYLTKQGYDPTKPLTWADLPERPFAEVKDPPLTGGAYRIGATLPADRTGHQVLFTIWQNSSTPDTYYSCSDVVFAKATNAAVGTDGSGGANGTAGPAGNGSGAATGSPAAGTPKPDTRSPSANHSHASHTTAPAEQTPDPVAAQARSAAPDSSPVASATDTGGGPSAPLLAAGAAAVLVLTAGVALALRLRSR
ncbi:lytic polysaccharide monooxygenase [Streptomyces sp. NPDC006700]|uniref:lytic polysaccharide monooxygenase auxiliary activity family 9 protein n=1 Tax=unclassified Streptomyces TaxID=2593676 RepID=UPI0033E0F6AE